MPREVIIPEQQVYEEIQSIEEFPDSKLVRVTVGVTDANGIFIVPQQYKQYNIDGNSYDELISANPSWDPEKPAGTYFNDDLWHFIDQQRQVG